MNLRTRILLGYGYLVSVLVLTAVGAALAFHRLGLELERVTLEDVGAVQASMEMLGALERQDSACLSAMLGREGAGDDFRREAEAFSRALEGARSRASGEDERKLIGDLEGLYYEYERACEDLLAGPPSGARSAYDLAVSPRFAAVRDAVVRLHEMNRRAMREAEVSTRRFAEAGSVVLGLVAAAVLLSFGFLSQRLNRDLLLRLSDMKEALADIAAGNRIRRFDPVLDDELGLLARQLNRALDEQAQAEGRMRGMLAQQRQLLLGLLARWGKPAALLGMDGALVASTLSEDKKKALLAEVDALRARGREALGEASGDLREVEIAAGGEKGEAIVFTPLVASGGRVVGWLATIRAEK